ncbi:MAG: GerMN domain-containing protein [Deltaproteobacteria bacterium]|nr:GerMN domain-containing protein [Deltaproteobacteria bacterium]
MKKVSKNKLLLWAFLLIFLVFGFLVGRKYVVKGPPHEPQVVRQEEAPRQVREVILYFGTHDGNKLIPESRELIDCMDQGSCIQATVQALINGPVGDLTPVFPSHTVLLGVTEKQGTAVVNFSRELQQGHPGGSASELLTVYGLVDTLAANFPFIRQVKILIEGREIESLKGHVDLSKPVPANFGFTLSGESEVPAGGLPEAPATEEEGRER